MSKHEDQQREETEPIGYGAAEKDVTEDTPPQEQPQHSEHAANEAVASPDEIGDPSEPEESGPGSGAE